MKPFNRFLLKIASIFFPKKVYGSDNLPKGEAVLVCNHFSFIDPVYLVSFIKEDISVLAKKELFIKKFPNKLLTSYGGIPIDRDNPDIKTIISVIKILKSGKKVAIFPEGTRNKTKTTDLQPIKSGSALFAVKAKCPIVPIMIQKKAKLFVRNKIIIGKPFELNEYYDKKLTPDDHKEMDNIVFNKMVEEQKRLLDIINSKRKINEIPNL